MKQSEIVKKELLEVLEMNNKLLEEEIIKIAEENKLLELEIEVKKSFIDENNNDIV